MSDSLNFTDLTFLGFRRLLRQNIYRHDFWLFWWQYLNLYHSHDAATKGFTKAQYHCKVVVSTQRQCYVLLFWTKAAVLEINWRKYFAWAVVTSMTEQATKIVAPTKTQTSLQQKIQHCTGWFRSELWEKHCSKNCLVCTKDWYPQQKGKFIPSDPKPKTGHLKRWQ